MKIYVLARKKAKFGVTSDFLIVNDNLAYYCRTYNELVINFQSSRFNDFGWRTTSDSRALAIINSLTYYKTLEEILTKYPELCL